MKANMNKISKHIVSWITSYNNSSDSKGYVIGVSGGIDSAVVSTLCAKTGLPLLILEMPIHQNIDEITRAKKHIEWLKNNYINVTSKEIDLTDTYETVYESFSTHADNVSKETFDFSMSNTRSRLRMTTLYQFSGMYNMLVCGTGNKVEDFGIGFFTKGGDGISDINPIGDLMKSEVYALGYELGIIEDILIATPTDGLHDDGRTDEEQIGATYTELESAMNYIELKSKTTGDNYRLAIDPKLITEREKEVLNIYNRLHKLNRHKMISIPICEIPTEIKYTIENA